MNLQYLLPILKNYICRLKLKLFILMKKIILLMLMGVLMVSCVSRKKLTYLQPAKSTADTGFYQLSRSKYKIQPNDILSIQVRSFDSETTKLFNSSSTGTLNASAGDLIFYLNGFTVDFDGNIEMPILGKINVVGKDIEEIQVVVESELKNYFKDDAVFVTVQLAGVRYSIVGDVSRPGKYVIYQNQVNIFEAIAQAGDITILGDRREVQILRQTPEGVKIVEIDLTSQDVLSNPYMFIQPNDIINIKPLPAKSFGIGTTGFQTFASILGVLASTATLIFTLSRIQ
jgi:polysaccharide export outer membrane protein